MDNKFEEIRNTIFQLFVALNDCAQMENITNFNISYFSPRESTESGFLDENKLFFHGA